LGVADLAELRELLARAPSIGVITGAGISAASGVPTYRGAGGLYDDPLAGRRVMEDLSGPTLQRDPARTWAVLWELVRRRRGAAPNAAHFALARLEARTPRFALLTQNVDGLHRLAGSRDPIEIHGDIGRARCTACGLGLPMPAEPPDAAPPRCPDCGAILRPDIVLFEEPLPLDPLQRIEEEFLRDPPAVVLSIGTSALFRYVQEPFLLAHALGRVTVEINPEATELSAFATRVLRQPAEDALPRLVD
jgi:NAD-dependent deacetylase